MGPKIKGRGARQDADATYCAEIAREAATRYRAAFLDPGAEQTQRAFITSELVKLFRQNSAATSSAPPPAP